MQTIRVETPSAKYDVTAGSGLIRTLVPRIERIAGRLPRRVFVITSPQIWALWGTTFLTSFTEPPITLFLPAGEQHKTMASVARLLREMVVAGGDRGSLLIAFVVVKGFEHKRDAGCSALEGCAGCGFKVSSLALPRGGIPSCPLLNFKSAGRIHGSAPTPDPFHQKPNSDH